MQMYEHQCAKKNSDWISNMHQTLYPFLMKKNKKPKSSSLQIMGHSLAFDQMNYGIFSLMNHGNIIENGEKICLRQSIWEMTLMG